MKDEQMKEFSPSDLPEQSPRVDDASDADFEFIPSSDTPLFITEDTPSLPDNAEAPMPEQTLEDGLAASDPEAELPEDSTKEDEREREAELPPSHEDIEAVTSEIPDENAEATENLPNDEALSESSSAPVDEPTLSPEDILAATEQKEEQISFFDEAEEDVKVKEEPQKERSVDTRFDFLEICIYTLVAVLVITTFFFRHSIVDGSSMEKTLSDKQHLILASFLYTPEAGDIIVCEDYSTPLRKPIVKRVIATEGQTVEIYGPKDVYVDGVPIDQSYAFVDGRDNTLYPIVHTVAEGHVFVMGDHRNASTDSRVIGDVSVDSILGKVVLRFSPFTIFD